MLSATQHRVLPDPCTIQQAVNAAQRKLAVPHLSQVSHTIGPEIMIPMSWQGSSMTLLSFAGPIVIPPSNFAGSIRYSLHHAAYATECKHLGKIVYAASLTETILLKITAVYEGAGACKKCGVVIGNICEGKKGIDTQIDAPGLIKLALETVVCEE
ncbi:uncharacterized protein F5147DRAFT_769737 [Suillus discolor]|uniref:Uncharacterized protein n=1 Tax=Suillus discolor TaxID=1912936 RepID=A0A9P7JYI9_9AGAM|nr:uncharacterized protein F5147DRAFT_769737 [Suillus discolor]KAG2115281.1 hypothetical protein F5147DRAFT_769737 [Suillus discolor]